MRSPWTYRSFFNDPNLAAQFMDLEFGRGVIRIEDAPFGVFKGIIGDTGWSLELNGSINYGNPFTVRFQGKGVVGKEEWIYDYSGNVVPPWPNGVNQRPAMVGTIVRPFLTPVAHRARWRLRASSLPGLPFAKMMQANAIQRMGAEGPLPAVYRFYRDDSRIIW
jgi:hypothetical protein